MSGPGDDDDGNGEEPRVKDLVRTGDAALQPTTRAQLEAWFGLPSFEEVAESAAKAPPAAKEPTQAERIQERRREASARVDPAVLAHAERIGVAARRMRTHDAPPRPWLSNARVLTFDESSVPVIPGPNEWRELDSAYRVKEALKICAPQASLRDLHRPEKEFYIRMQSPWDDVGEPPPADPWEPIRASIRRDYRVGTTVTPSPQATRESLAALRAVLAMPWPEAKRAKARQREADFLAAEEAAGKEPDGAPVVRGPEGTS